MYFLLISYSMVLEDWVKYYDKFRKSPTKHRNVPSEHQAIVFGATKNLRIKMLQFNTNRNMPDFVGVIMNGSL